MSSVLLPIFVFILYQKIPWQCSLPNYHLTQRKDFYSTPFSILLLRLKSYVTILKSEIHLELGKLFKSKDNASTRTSRYTSVIAASRLKTCVSNHGNPNATQRNLYNHIASLFIITSKMKFGHVIFF